MRYHLFAINRESFRSTRAYFLAIFIDSLTFWIFRPLRFMLYRSDQSVENFRSGLIHSWTHIGDLLCLSPSVEELIASTPNIRWHILTNNSTNGLFKEVSIIPINTVPITANSKWPNLKLALALRKFKFDVVLSGHTTTAIPYASNFVLMLTMLFLKPRRLYAHSFKGFGVLANYSVRTSRPVCMGEYFAILVADLCGRKMGWSIQPRNRLCTAEQKLAKNLLAKYNIDEKSTVVLVFPTAVTFAFYWPDDVLIYFVRRLQEVEGITVLLCSGKEDFERFDAVARSCGRNVYPLSGVAIPTILALLAECSLVVTPDSGGRHMGNAANCPVIYIKNPIMNSYDECYCSNEEMIDLWSKSPNRFKMMSMTESNVEFVLVKVFETLNRLK